MQLLSHVQLFVTPWTTAHQALLSFTISQSLLQLMSIESIIPFNHFIICHPFSSWPQSFLASESFPISHLFTSGGQRIRASASASVFPMNIQGWFPLGWTGLISLQSKGLPGVFSSTTIWEHQFFDAEPNIMAQLSHPYMTTGKTISLTRWTFVGKVMSLLFNMLLCLFVAKNPHLRDPLLVCSAPRLSVKQ